MAGVKAGCVHLCRVAGNTVIPYGKWYSVAVPWNTSINGYTVPLPFLPLPSFTIFRAHLKTELFCAAYFQKVHTRLDAVGVGLNKSMNHVLYCFFSAYNKKLEEYKTMFLESEIRDLQKLLREERSQNHTLSQKLQLTEHQLAVERLSVYQFMHIHPILFNKT